MIDVWSQGAIVGTVFGFIGGYHLALRKYNKEREASHDKD